MNTICRTAAVELQENGIVRDVAGNFIGRLSREYDPHECVDKAYVAERELHSKNEPVLWQYRYLNSQYGVKPEDSMTEWGPEQVGRVGRYERRPLFVIPPSSSVLLQTAEMLNAEVTKLRQALEKCELFKLQPDTVQQVVNIALRSKGKTK